MTVVDNISRNMDRLSNKQKNIAEYLIRNSRKIGFMSLKEISEAVNVSEVTILNFCKTIDIDSFTELKRLFQELVKQELHIPTEIKYSLLELESIDDAYDNTIQIQKFNYEKIIRENNMDTIADISKKIIDAERIYICGMGMSKVVAEYLDRRLKLIYIDSKIVDIGDILPSCIDIQRSTNRDIFILISFPEYSPNVIGLSRYLSQNHISFISITDGDNSPLAKNSTHILKCPSDSLVFHNFISSTICLVEILLVIISFNMKDKLVPHFDNLERLQSSLIKNINK